MDQITYVKWFAQVDPLTDWQHRDLRKVPSQLAASGLTALVEQGVGEYPRCRYCRAPEATPKGRSYGLQRYRRNSHDRGLSDWETYDFNHALSTGHWS